MGAFFLPSGLYMSCYLSKVKLEQKARQERRTGYHVTISAVLFFQEVMCTKIHIKYNVLISGKVQYPATFERKVSDIAILTCSVFPCQLLFHLFSQLTFSELVEKINLKDP